MLSQNDICVQILNDARHYLPDIEQLPIPIDLIYLASHLGYKVEDAKIQQQGYITEEASGRRLIRVRMDDPPKVKRFTVAHEIGHILLNISERGPSNRTKKFRLHTYSPEERLANRLAAELLMPVARFEAELSKHDTASRVALGAMAGRFDVSSIACLRRITELPHFVGFSYLFGLSTEAKDHLKVHSQNWYSSKPTLRFGENPGEVVGRCCSSSLRDAGEWEGKLRMVSDHEMIIPAFCSLYQEKEKSFVRLSGWAKIEREQTSWGTPECRAFHVSV